jgi:hypothetical protein
MLRIINKLETQDIIKMADMPANTVAKVVNDKHGCNGHYVFMVYNRCYFDLTDGSFWNNGNETLVKLLPPGEKIIVEFFNEE